MGTKHNVTLGNEMHMKYRKLALKYLNYLVYSACYSCTHLALVLLCVILLNEGSSFLIKGGGG